MIVYGYKDESEDNNNDQVVVIANFSEYDRTVNNVPFLSPGTWYDVMEPGNDLVTDDGNYGEYFIEGKTAIIYSNQQWDQDVQDRVTLPQKYGIIHSFPNPFNSRIQIKLNLDNDVRGKLMVYDLRGNLVSTLKEGIFSQGDHTLYWDSTSMNGVSLSSGIYVVSFRSKTNSINSKVLLVK